MKNEIRRARARIEDHIRLTECRRSAMLSEVAEADVWLKLENTQLSGSFKIRGVMNRLLTLSPDEKSKRLVTASTGNHGAAFAHGVTQLGHRGPAGLTSTLTPGVTLRVSP